MNKPIRGIPVLFENDFCLVLNKPAGLSVQGGEGVKISLDSLLSETISPRPFLVHRLDRDTSGILLVAKTKDAAAGFSALFSGGKTEKNRGVVKQYLAVCSGVPGSSKGVIRLDLEERNKSYATVSKKSETFFRLLSGENPGDATFSLLELELGTGRMHQIRRHLALTGNPILGDDKYGDFSLNKKLRKTRGLKHLLLHASRLIIRPVPVFMPEGLDIAAPPPEYFLKNLPCNPELINTEPI